MSSKVLASLVRRRDRAKWFVYAGAYGQRLVKIPHTSSMPGHWPGYDVECYCGWASKTGGAIKARVAEARVWTTLRLAAGSRPSFARKKTPRALADRLRVARVRVLAPDVGACPVARVAPRGVVRSLLR
jgi:hypothetical protein